LKIKLQLNKYNQLKLLTGFETGKSQFRFRFQGKAENFRGKDSYK